LDQVTQQNSAVAQSSSTQAEQLHAQSQALSDLVVRLESLVTGEAISAVQQQPNNVREFKVINKKKVDLPKFKKASGENHVTKTPKHEDF
jgi:hypothetical protein